MNAIVIVGAGLAGYTLARELRKLDRESPITIVTRDRGDFYAKPSLSNALAQSKAPEQLVTTPGPALASQLGIDLLHADDGRADRRRSAGRCTPPRARSPTTGWCSRPGPIRSVLPSRATRRTRCARSTISTTTGAFRAQIGAGRRVAILGAGLIGSEFANDLRAAGVEVDVVDLAARPLAALLPEQAGRWFEQRLAQAGVRWHFGDAAQALVDARRAARAVLAQRCAAACRHRPLGGRPAPAHRARLRAPA